MRASKQATSSHSKRAAAKSNDTNKRQIGACLCTFQSAITVIRLPLRRVQICANLTQTSDDKTRALCWLPFFLVQVCFLVSSFQVARRKFLREKQSMNAQNAKRKTCSRFSTIRVLFRYYNYNNKRSRKTKARAALAVPFQVSLTRRQSLASALETPALLFAAMKYLQLGLRRLRFARV